MAIRNRRGNKADFDPNKLLSGESASALDTKEFYHSFGPGNVHRMTTYENMKDHIKEINAEIVDELTAGAVATTNETVNLVLDTIDGVNNVVDNTTKKPYTLKVDNSEMYLEEVPLNPSNPEQSVRVDIENLKTNKLDKTGDSKDAIVTFSEHVTDTDIKTGEKHSVVFGKILKSIKTLRDGLTNKFDKTNIVMTDQVNDNNKVAGSGVTYSLGKEIDAIMTQIGTMKQNGIVNITVPPASTGSPVGDATGDLCIVSVSYYVGQRTGTATYLLTQAVSQKRLALLAQWSSDGIYDLDLNWWLQDNFQVINKNATNSMTAKINVIRLL